MRGGALNDGPRLTADDFSNQAGSAFNGLLGQFIVHSALETMRRIRM